MNTSSHIRRRIEKGLERDRRFEKHFEAFSRKLWPYHKSNLVYLLAILSLLDGASTWAAIEMSGKDIVEIGIIGRWSLYSGGYVRLFLIEIVAVTVLVSLALGLDYLMIRLGFAGLGRAAFVFLLLPTMVTVILAVFNNIIIALI